MMKNIKLILILGVLVFTSNSCEKDFLEEEPLDFLSSANAFNSSAGFESSTNNLYFLVRDMLFTRNETTPFEYSYRTDIGLFVPSSNPPNLDGELAPTGGMPTNHWNSWYKVVSEANTIISRLEFSDLKEEEAKIFEARAKFFRAYAYSRLAYLFGGVPILAEEVTSPKTDYVRATREQVYALCIEDLIFAGENLKGITEVKDGEVSNLAAKHLLAEVYNTNGNYDKAIAAASDVINDPATALMTSRFGSRQSETPGDVYWDLFRKNNQNRSAGNTESILVMQIEDDTPGGAGDTTISGWPFNSVYNLERVHEPLIRDVRLPDSDGNLLAMAYWPASDYTSGGRGVGFLAPSDYFVHNAYQAGDPSDFTNDIRNANHNFVRKFEVTRPGNDLYPVGTLIDFDDIPEGAKGFSGADLVSGDVFNRAMYPFQTKATTIGNHPSNLYEGSTEYPDLLKHSAAGTFRDEYLFRLAGTYLLRAEAYLGNGDLTSAAADINVVRARSNASAISSSQVDIDFILDERMREFGIEEKRMFTLMRLGKWYDRIIKCNPFYAQSAEQRYNLWPIPFAEIERNTDTELEQNPGY
ncbi:RagB/SusD family nutrient uptake outer membrane protein [Galbibacter sp. EGI 63066]|uniref:RagB/SusD family nutrient uptake outer membrane protein n=1 Tax=Galbibacter sp. EGI 63066 TaxID=2993559 RepID=UPI00224990B0|nr:RagB/SusD family nutrient uptake outer membrane protein [Galbibacter sp. EGI 63066]MCX2678666.1 RagB/SusD family nutrient uptake outer membrane protein [Galbibacter sp. EGI 63066]